MSERQRFIIITVIVIVVAMLVYPPFHKVGSNGRVTNMGYGWIFDPPKLSTDYRYSYNVATVNISMLLIQWCGVLIVGGLAYFLAKGSNLAKKTEYPIKSLKGVKGWLLFLCISLTIIGPLTALGRILISLGSKAYIDEFPSLRTAINLDAFFGIMLVAFSVFSGYSLWTIKQNAIKITKLYFMTLLGYVIVSPFIFISIANVPSELNSVLVDEGVKQAFGGIVTFAVWYIYLNRSKRVRETYTEWPLYHKNQTMFTILIPKMTLRIKL